MMLANARLQRGTELSYSAFAAFVQPTVLPQQAWLARCALGRAQQADVMHALGSGITA